MSIADLLARSREAHAAYRDALPRRVASGSSTLVVAGNTEVAGAHLAAACRARAEAHVLDPDRADPAWTDEETAYPHLALLEFYVAQLTAESVPVQASNVDLAGAEQTATAALDPAPVLVPSLVTL